MSDTGKHSIEKIFEWFYQNITIPTCNKIRSTFGKTIPMQNPGVELPDDSQFVLWGDSDIPYLQRMTSPERIQNSMENGLLFAKFGAKTTENTQPLDLGPFFKILRMNGKNMTSEGTEKPLTFAVNTLFKRLRTEKNCCYPQSRRTL